MGFSHLFILQLRSWPCSLGPPDLDSRPNLFDLLIFDHQHLLAFDLLLQHLLAFDLLPLPLHPSAPIGLQRQYNFITSEIISCAPERPSPTCTLCKAATYQYPLRGRHLLVPFTKSTPTSTLYKANTYQYLCGASIYQY